MSLRPRLVAAALLGALALIVGAGAPAAQAATPSVEETWAYSVQITTARLQAKINPEGKATTYHFDYITKAAYEANLDEAKGGFEDAQRIPPINEAGIGSGSSPVTVLQQLGGLNGGTTYYYRVLAQNEDGTAEGPIHTLRTREIIAGADSCLNQVAREQGAGRTLPDCRGYEMVSPIDKNGGQVDAPGAILGGGVLQAAANGQSVTYGSTASFGSGAQGAPPASQYLAARNAGGWSTENVTEPIFSGSFGEDEGAPYRIFSGDLARALLLNGDHCRGDSEGCAVPNPPLAGTDAPPGYQNYYLREGSGYEALFGAFDLTNLALAPEHFDLSLAGSSTDLRHAVLSSCAALTPDATETLLGEGCDPAKPNLYLWSNGALSLINATPGAGLGAQSGAISNDGSSVYWNDLASGDLYLRSGSQSTLIDTASAFETASGDGSIAYYSKAGHLYRYDAIADTATDLTPVGDLQGVFGASADGLAVYYQTASSLIRRRGKTMTEVASSADEGNYPPATGTARVSTDGSRLIFMATDPITGYDNTDQNTGLPTSQVYLYAHSTEETICVSCNPTNGRPIGGSSIPGAIANGEGPAATVAYKPRVMNDAGTRVFFESGDAIGGLDTNDDTDVYQWEAQGTGSCTREGGCASLISTGKDKGVTFVDASASGDDVFFLTGASPVLADPGGIDLYDARVGGGFATPPPPLACDADACQPLPPPPVNPTLTTRLTGPGNPGVRYEKRCKPGTVKRGGKCVSKNGQRKGKAKRRANRKGGAR